MRGGVGVLVLIAPLPIWRYVIFFARRRRRSLSAIFLGAGLLAYSTAAIVGAAAASKILWFLAGAAGLATVGAAVASRPRFGHRRGLPPGPLTILPTRPFTDFGHLMALAETHGPIFKISNTLPTPRLRPTVCVVGLELGLELLEVHDDALAAPAVPTSRGVPTAFLRNMSRADHEVYSAVFRSAATAANRDVFDAESERIVAQTLHGIRAAGDLGVEPRQHLTPMVEDLLLRSILGVANPSDAARVKQAVTDIETGANRWRRIEPGRRRFRDAIDCVKKMDLTDDDECPSLLSAAIANMHDGTDMDTVVGNAIQMQALGTIDVSGLLVWALYTLAVNPSHAEHLRIEADKGTRTESATTGFLRELLRMQQSEYLVRDVQRDIRFGGYAIPRGWLVRICVRESHRLPQVFDQPDSFDAERFSNADFDRTQYAPFGLHRHHCIGARLTIDIARQVIDQLLRSHAIHVARDAPVEFGRSHWQPGGQLRLRLADRPAN